MSFTPTPGIGATTANPATCRAETSNSYSCTLYFVLAPASYTGTAAGEATAKALSIDTEPVAIVANMANSFTLTLHAIVESLQSTPQYIGVLSEIQVELATTPTTDTTDPITITFAGADADSESAIQIAPESRRLARLTGHRKEAEPQPKRHAHDGDDECDGIAQ